MTVHSGQAYSRRSDLTGLIVFLLACAVVGGISAAVTALNVGAWYPGLHKPAFTPPNWLFGPVWSVIYLCVAVAGWRVWRRRDPRDVGAMILYAGQLAFNLLWSVLFFGMHRIGVALLDIAALLVVVVATLLAFWRRDRLAGALFVPYAAWVAFAAVLNAAIWRLN